jgi:hypothetical protein
VTSVHMVPASDPSSVEHHLRDVRKVRDLRADGWPAGPGFGHLRSSLAEQRRTETPEERERRQQRSAEHDAERIVDLLARMATERYLEGELNGNLEEVQRRWLWEHGYERSRVDAALVAGRRALARRPSRSWSGVGHPPSPSGRAAASNVTAGGGVPKATGDHALTRPSLTSRRRIGRRHCATSPSPGRAARTRTLGGPGGGSGSPAAFPRR